MTESAGDSSEQQNAEEWLLNELSKELGLKLIKQKFDLEGARQIELDGFCESPLVLCEAWSHIGPPVGCQKDKVMTDALKLIFVNNTLFKGEGKCILLFADHDAAALFQRDENWRSQCLKYYDIKIKIIKFTQERKAKILEAQERQKR
jgi:hypothetical protein